MQTAYITHPFCHQHDNGPHHPECAARLNAIEDQLIASGLYDYLRHYQASQAGRDQLLRVHHAAYLDWVEATVPAQGLLYLQDDITLSPMTWQAALHAAGAVINAVDLVMAGEVENAFCAIRPPGHHAMRNRAMGFCILNNIAVGAAHALDHHRLPRVAIVDFDVHHGNGTEDMVRDDARILFCSTFQHPFYPGCGADSANAHVINVPLAAGADGDAFRHAISEHWLPALDAFKPELLLISAGFDAHLEDDMAMLRLREADYAWVTAELKAVAERHASGRIVSALEGGYALNALGRSAVAHIRVLAGI
jgi:acetoin utilization deacetylase AcuC-like enzyme